MRAFDFLRAGLEALPATEDPAADLVEVGLVFRRLATGRPALYSIGVQRDVPDLPPWQPVCDAADAAFAVLVQRVARLGDAGLLGEHTVIDATLQFHVLCEGLATLELRGVRIPFDAEHIWRAATPHSSPGSPRVSPRASAAHNQAGQHQRVPGGPAEYRLAPKEGPRGPASRDARVERPAVVTDNEVRSLATIAGSQREPIVG